MAAQNFVTFGLGHEGEEVTDVVFDKTVDSIMCYFSLHPVIRLKLYSVEACKLWPIISEKVKRT